MRQKSIKTISVSLLLSISLIFGTAGQALAQSANQADKIDVLVSFKERPGKDEQTLIENEGGRVKKSYHLVPAVSASMPKGKLEALRRHPKVASVDEDIPVKIIGDTVPWGVDRIDAEVVHSQNKGRGVKVAILDTGIDLDHPDLRVAGNVTFFPGTTNGDDDNGHGTMVAGIVAALENGTGIVGVAPEVALYSVKVLDRNGGGVISVILAGIEWAVDNRMQVINMSFGGVMNMPTVVIEALQKAYDSGIVLVAGAGNDGDTGIIYAPARFAPVIAVGATGKQDARAGFSSTGSTLGVVAPGVDILTTARGGGYGQGSGTSFSTPHVTGMAALLIASGVTSNVRVRQLLQGTAEDLGPSGWDKWYGYGLVNIAAATNTRRELKDTLPPTTKIEVNGRQGNQGWYLSDVTVKLTAADDAGGSGVAGTQYSLDDGMTWLNYTAPFTISKEGITTIQARSKDKAGNEEQTPVKSQVKIDKTAPGVSVSATPDVLSPANGRMVDVTITASVSDSLSGVSSFNVTARDEYGKIEPVIGAQLQSRIKLEARREGNDPDGRVYTITITAKDIAGNQASAQTTVIVPRDQGNRAGK